MGGGEISVARRERSCFIRSWGCGGTSFTRRQMATIVIIMITVNNTNVIVIGHQQSHITATTNTNVVDIALVIGIVNDMILKIPHMVFSTITIVIVNFSDFFNTFTDSVLQELSNIWC